ncbi:histidine kinase [Marivirga sp.]|uniref:sensor histidine kinase n=1 Tax=Marivirga sp. TaxID=2018662 RepID=UPI002D7E4C18|nr:histidine kinase [Marivirga sp.]HET8861574.1 histidine kinase [Marivirga sp.]
MTSFLSSFIYSNEIPWRITRHICFWTAYVIFATLLYGSKGVGVTYGHPDQIEILGLAFVEAIFFLPIHILFSYGLIYLLIPRFLFKGQYMLLFLSTLSLMILVAALSFVIANTLVSSFRDSLGIPSPPSYFFFGLMAGLRGGTTVAGFAAAIKLSKYWYQKHWANQALEKQNLQAELQLLKSQIHPHFLFNTLNNLYSLTLMRSENAPNVVLKLSDLLSYMLYECNQPKVVLEKELKLMYGYIELEKLRYGSRLDVQMKVVGTAKNQLIAPLLFLPFLENAFKFGVSEMWLLHNSNVV